MGAFTPEQAFNLEKEHKIINPHQMDMKTTARIDFQPFSVMPQRRVHSQKDLHKVPFSNGSQY